jgi:hypothetical protein
VRSTSRSPLSSSCRDTWDSRSVVRDTCKREILLPSVVVVVVVVFVDFC